MKFVPVASLIVGLLIARRKFVRHGRGGLAAVDLVEVAMVAVAVADLAAEEIVAEAGGGNGSFHGAEQVVTARRDQPEVRLAWAETQRRLESSAGISRRLVSRRLAWTVDEPVGLSSLWLGLVWRLGIYDRFWNGARNGLCRGVTAPWSWGYYGYYNPYWMGPMGGAGYINYSQPVVMSGPSSPPPPAVAAQQQTDALTLFDSVAVCFAKEIILRRGSTDRAIAYEQTTA